MSHGYSYQGALSAAEKVNWRLEEVLPAEARLDFSRPFLPEALARVRALRLSPDEQRVLNQVRAFEYLGMFGLVEQFILPFVLDHARERLADDPSTRALLGFAQEEAKHIELFRRFRALFEAGFGSRCDLIGPPEEIARAVLAHHPLAVALVTLHIEWFTQSHWLECARDDQAIDALFKSLLRHHWMEESQHAKLDTLIVEAIAATCTPEEVRRGFEDYLEIGAFLDQGLAHQLGLNLEAFERATGRRLGADERARIEASQRQALRWTYLGSGMTHPAFQRTVGELDPALRARLEQVAPAFC